MTRSPPKRKRQTQVRPRQRLAKTRRQRQLLRHPSRPCTRILLVRTANHSLVSLRHKRSLRLVPLNPAWTLTMLPLLYKTRTWILGPLSLGQLKTSATLISILSFMSTTRIALVSSKRPSMTMLIVLGSFNSHFNRIYMSLWGKPDEEAVNEWRGADLQLQRQPPNKNRITSYTRLFSFRFSFHLPWPRVLYFFLSSTVRSMMEGVGLILQIFLFGGPTTLVLRGEGYKFTWETTTLAIFMLFYFIWMARYNAQSAFLSYIIPIPFRLPLLLCALRSIYYLLF